MKLRQRIRFYQQLGVLVRAGVPIRGSIERLKDRIRGRELVVLSEKINAGERIGDAFVAAGFSPFECHLVAAGERSAQLDTIFEHLAEYWTRELHLRQALIRPLIYPIVILHLVILLSAAIDAVTVGVNVAIGHLIAHLIVFYVVGFLVYVGVRASWASESMRRFWFYVPLVGGALQATYAYRWITALKLQFVAGVTISRAIGDAWIASGYAGGERIGRESEEAIRQGVPLSKLMETWRQLPRDWIDFIETGEVSGKLETAFVALETEAARMWRLAQDRLSEWAPKIAYFAALIFVAVQVGSLMYRVEVQPLIDAEKEIDAASGH